MANTALGVQLLPQEITEKIAIFCYPLACVTNQNVLVFHPLPSSHTYSHISLILIT